MSGEEGSNISTLVQQARDLYAATFGGKDDGKKGPLFCTVAPGRVNLIGEHTDYNDGFVLPMPIEYSTVCWGSGQVRKLSSDEAKVGGACRVVSTSSGAGSVVTFYAHHSMEPTGPQWTHYVAGTVDQYMKDLQTEDGDVWVVEFDLVISGDVPLGSGLSSSASLVVSVASFLECIMGDAWAYRSIPTILSRQEEAEFDGKASALAPRLSRKIQRAVRCRAAEHVFLKSMCGIMDQYVSSAGQAGSAMLIDCQSLDYKVVPIVHKSSEKDKAAQSSKVAFVITNSHVQHDNVGGEYPIRVRQCQAAAKLLGVDKLRGATLEDLQNKATAGDDGTLVLGSGEEAATFYKRARHVIAENQRTLDAMNALSQQDWTSMGKLMKESHVSMKDDYEVSCEEIDVLVEIANSVDGVYGSRLTGGGFGGCTVTLVDKEAAPTLMDTLRAQYKARLDKECTCFVTSPGNGARQVTLP